MKSALRFGLLYLLALLLLLAFGHRNQLERARLAQMEARLERLRAEENALLKETWRLSQPHRVLEWAEREGFIPLSQGRWAR
ncbi:hypothetical protein SAMN04488243_12118 [Thermus arciformis]|uniref:Cell division protein FtsL n=1 Tax=Thermus arciformis TaxID=482827 RepID=A0A1G7HRU9_9DEIN|nr:hypothetical protein [Thermus arciformis]SDF03014.1 hypothetical protein SAMN04488243_12118 [Thermus arciformis]